MSIVSKSRGTSVSAKTARASSRIWPPDVARGEMRQREQAYLGVGRDLGRLARGAVPLSERRASASSWANVASCTSTSARCAATTTASVGAVSPVTTTRRPARATPMTCCGMDAPTRLAALQAPEVRPRRDSETLGELGIETAGPVVLDQRVAERGRRGGGPRTGRSQVVAADGLARARGRTASAHSAAGRRPGAGARAAPGPRAGRGPSAASRGRAARRTSAFPAARASGRHADG